MSNFTVTVVDVRDYMRLKHVRIEPDADAAMLLIAGNNGQGKTSLISALSVALGGPDEMPDDPVRHGAEQASIIMTLASDRGEYAVRRIIKPDGKQHLEIRGPDGLLKSAQTWLNKLIGERFLDPLTFINEEPKEQRRLLLAVAGVDTTRLDNERAQHFGRRTEVGRDLARARGEYERLPAPAPRPPEARATSTVTADLVDTEGKLRQIAAMRTHAINTRRACNAAEEACAAASERLRQAQADFDAANRRAADARAESIAAAEQADELAGESVERELVEWRVSLQAELGRAETAARWQASSEQMNRRRADAEAQVSTLSAQYAELTTTIEEIDRQKEVMLSNATMPVDGLAFTDDGVTLGGVPFAQASQAEKLRCSLAVSMKLAPGLRDVLCRDGALLDDDSIEALRLLAERNGCRVWIERVGERDPGAIIIRDGAVVESQGEVSPPPGSNT